MNKRPLAVVITDTHMHDKNIDLVKDVFSQTFLFCQEKGINVMFHGGDWFTSRTGQSIACLLATQQIIEEMALNDIEMWAIAGNHDKADQTIPESFLSIFNLYKGFRLHNWGGSYRFDCGVNVSMVPYFTDEVYSKQLETVSKFIEKDEINILITHVAVNGVRNNDGSEVTTGLGQNLFNQWDKVLVGHYHNESKFGKNIYYIGSAYQANFGEDDNKGFTVIYDDGSIEQVKTDFPRYIKFKVNSNEMTAKDIKDLKDLKEMNPADNYRIVLTGTEQEVNSFDKSLLESIGISVDKKPTDVEALEPELEIEMVSYNRDNITEAFNEFCNSKKIEDRTYGLELLKKL
jgi:exonuclease SbcD